MWTAGRVPRVRRRRPAPAPCSASTAGAGALDIAGLQRRHRARRMLRLVLDPRHGAAVARRSVRLPAPMERVACAHGECATRHAALDRHRRGHLADRVACRNRRGSSVQGKWLQASDSRDDRGSADLSPARFDAGVVAGANERSRAGSTAPSPRRRRPEGRRCVTTLADHVRIWLRAFVA
jgi:hypothetical protein